MAKILKWQDEIIARISNMSNRELLEYYLKSASQGDDYEGEFTARGAWEKQFIEEQLRNRLSEWLKQ